MSKILVLGKTGQLARAIADIAQAHPGEMIFADRKMADFLNPQCTLDCIRSVLPDIIINAAAYTKVDQAEKEQQTAYAINGTMPGEIGALCAKLDIQLIHFSTDFVFDGNTNRPYTENYTPNPVNYYGLSKYHGEQTIMQSGCHAIIIRTSWVFSSYGQNFVKTMLRLAQDRRRLDIVADQIGQPTAASDLASLSIRLAAQLTGPEWRKSGLYHYSGAGPVSRADFAREIFKQAGLNMDVTDIRTTDYPMVAQRPAYSVLACDRIRRDFKIDMPDWRRSLNQTLTVLSKTCGLTMGRI